MAFDRWGIVQKRGSKKENTFCFERIWVFPTVRLEGNGSKELLELLGKFGNHSNDHLWPLLTVWEKSAGTAGFTWLR